MDLFFLCWSFDSRWLFRIKNPCYQLIFTIPLFVNASSLIWTYIQKSIHSDDVLPFYIEVIVLLALLAISNLYLVCIIRMNSSQKISNIKDNYVAIQQFYHEYETKKVVWSFIGLILTVLAVSLTLIQSVYINRNSKLYDPISNKFRYWIDLICYGYLVLNFMVFILVKAVYLLSAWVFCPALYLRIKKIID